MNKKSMILINQPKGGVGKTTVAEFAHATCQASGLRTLVVDADDGNSGFIRRSGKGSALPLSWTTDEEAVQAFIEKHINNHDVTIFDLGANLSASDAPVTGFLAELVTRMAGAARIVFLAVAAPNAPGVGRLIRHMRDDYGSLGEVIVVENDVDGSGAFSKSLATVGIAKIALEHIDPGVQAVRLLREEALLKVLESPGTDYDLATARYASNVLAFAKQDRVRDIFGDGGLDRLGKLAAQKPLGLHYRISSLARANNTAIRLNHDYGTAHRALLRADKDNSDDLCAKALQFISAANAYHH